jgi:PAS domain-containing protein
MGHGRLAHADEWEIIRTGRPLVWIEERRVGLDGRVRWLSTTKMPLRDKDGTIIGTFGVSRTITERKQAEEALCESEERFRTLAKATNDAVWDWNLGTNKVWWNEGVLTLFGNRLDNSEADPLWWLERVHPEDRSAEEAFFLEVVHGKEPTWVDEYQFRCADGSYKDVYDRGYSWPGNLRELQSVLKQALLRAHGPVLLPDFLTELPELPGEPAAPVAPQGGASIWKRSSTSGLAPILVTCTRRPCGSWIASCSPAS